jgi:hypothetical protein
MPEIEELAEAVGEVMHVVAGLLAERDAWRKVREANIPLSRRAPAVRMIIDLAKRPPPPRPTEAGVASGAWVVTMARHVKPFSSDLADLLGHAWPPGADALRGAPSVSERVEKALRIVDAAALRLQRRLDRAAQTDSDRSTHQATDTDPAEQARRELAALGIELDDEMQEATP